MEPDSSSYASDWAKACEYRSQSIMFVEEQLGVRPVKVTKAPTVVCSLFKDVATTLLQAPRQVNIGRLAQDLRFFMESNGVEQHLRLSGKLPTFQEYWSFRHGTGAVDSICTFALYVIWLENQGIYIIDDGNRYMLNTTLPDTLCWVPEVMIMRRETSKQSIL